MFVRSTAVALFLIAALVIPYLLTSSFGNTGSSEDVDCTQYIRFLPEPPPTLTVRLDSVAAFPNGQHPVWSPDGRWIAYKAKGDLYVAPIDESEPPRMVGRGPLSAASQSVVWSPDSKRVAFVSRHTCLLPDGRRVLCQRSSLQSATITGDVDTLVHVEEEWLHDLFWSRDGTLSFVQGRDEAQHDISIPSDGIGDSLHVDPRPSVALVLRQRPSLGVRDTGQKPFHIYSVFPGGQKVLCTTFLGCGDYDCLHSVIMDLQGRMIADLAETRPAGGSEYTDISPDGRYAVGDRICQGPDERLLSSDIVIASSDGAWEARVTRTASILESDPRWSPDGNYIAYSASNVSEDTVALVIARIEIGGIDK